MTLEDLARLTVSKSSNYDGPTPVMEDLILGALRVAYSAGKREGNMAKSKYKSVICVECKTRYYIPKEQRRLKSFETCGNPDCDCRRFRGAIRKEYGVK